MSERIRIARRGSLLLLSMACVAAGCSRTAENVSRLVRAGEAEAMSRRYDGFTVGALRPIVDRAFRNRYTLNVEASGPTLWVSQPQEMSAEDKKDSSIVLRAGQRHRRIAELQLLRDPDGTIVRCQVRIERLDTLERTSFARQRGDDRPTDTPIDTMGGGTTETVEHWTTIARDRRAEQELIAGVTAGVEASG